jgi:hypothetical protein
MDNLSPLGDLFKKLFSFRAIFSLPVSCKPLWKVPFGIDFLRKFKVTVAPEISQIHFACTTVASPALSSLLTAASSASLFCLVFRRFQLRFQLS